MHLEVKGFFIYHNKAFWDPVVKFKLQSKERCKLKAVTAESSGRSSTTPYTEIFARIYASFCHLNYIL